MTIVKLYFDQESFSRGADNGPGSLRRHKSVWQQMPTKEELTARLAQENFKDLDYVFDRIPFWPTPANGKREGDGYFATWRVSHEDRGESFLYLGVYEYDLQENG